MAKKAASKQTAPTALNHDTIVIYNDDGNFYYVNKSVWSQYKVPDNMTAQLSNMVTSGTVLAGIGDNASTGQGAACYLINKQMLDTISSHQKAAIKAPAKKKKK
jgi:ABC-type branched-subunit amino acid transport system permease subunit